MKKFFDILHYLEKNYRDEKNYIFLSNHENVYLQTSS